MASEDRSISSAVVATSEGADSLLAHGGDYAFFQALRLLRLRSANAREFGRRVRVRPAASLAFPDRDIEKIECRDDGRYRITTNFFGLYGVTSPLPTFYTEDLIAEHLQGNDTPRDFLDILHAALYPLLFRAWEKNRIWLAVAEQHDIVRLSQLYALVGLGSRAHNDWPVARALLRHAGNFNRFPRSALGLESLVRGLLEDLAVSVEPCVCDMAPIPDSAQCRLSTQACRLGEDTIVGSQMTERTSSLMIQIGPITGERLQHLLPDAPEHARLVDAVTLYLPTPLRCTLALHVPPAQRHGARLGQGWSRLGLNTWLPDDEPNCPTPSWPRHDEVFLPISTDPARHSLETLQ